MNELENILLDGEKVFWSGKPDWTNAESPKRGWRAKAGTLKFMAAMLFAFLAMMTFGLRFNPDGFAGGMLGVLIILAAIAFVIALMSFISPNNQILIRPDHVYALSDRRLIIHDPSRESTTSLIRPIVYDVSVCKNGEVKNITITYAHPEDNLITLYALTDAAQVEKLLLERFAYPKEK